MTVRIAFFAATLALACGAGWAADDSTNAGKFNKSEAKQLKAQSEAEYKAKGKVAEGNEELNKANCEGLTGAAKRACKQDAKAAAKSDKAHAKAEHEAEEAQIKAMKK